MSTPAKSPIPKPRTVADPWRVDCMSDGMTMLRRFLYMRRGEHGPVTHHAEAEVLGEALVLFPELSTVPENLYGAVVDTCWHAVMYLHIVDGALYGWKTFRPRRRQQARRTAEEAWEDFENRMRWARASFPYVAQAIHLAAYGPAPAVSE
jgi:hypothetical protein